MPLPLAIPAVLAGISAIGGLLGGRRGDRTATSQSQYNQSSTTGLNPQGQGVLDRLSEIINHRLTNPTDMAGYRSQGLGNLNSTFQTMRQVLENNLTRRGLAGSPVGAVANNTLDVARGGQAADFLNSLPLLQRDQQTQDIGLMGSLLSFYPRTTTGSGTQSGSQTYPGGMASGAFGSAAEMLAFLAGSGAFGQGGGRGVGTGTQRGIADFLSGRVG